MGLRYAYPNALRPAVAGIDLALEAGTVTAILGPNGGGKTTLLRLMAGLLRPQEGRVLWRGEHLHGLSSQRRAKTIAMAAQRPDLPLAWTAMEVVLMGRLPHLGARAFEDSQDHAIARKALVRLDAEALAGRPFGGLSGGEQQRVLLARTLCQDTPLIALDEPTSQMDPKNVSRVARLCRELASEGKTVVAVLHDVNLAAQVADAIALVKDGRMLASGSPADVLTPDQLQAAYDVSSERLELGGRPVIVFDGDA